MCEVMISSGIQGKKSQRQSSLLSFQQEESDAGGGAWPTCHRMRSPHQHTHLLLVSRQLKAQLLRGHLTKLGVILHPWQRHLPHLHHELSYWQGQPTWMPFSFKGYQLQNSPSSSDSPGDASALGPDYSSESPLSCESRKLSPVLRWDHHRWNPGSECS